MPIEARPKTYAFATSVRWTEGRRGVMTASGKPDVEVASPPEFKGPAGVWSPEDLYVSAANVCLMTTFLAMAERGAVAIASYDSAGEGKLELVEGGFRFTHVTLRPRVVVQDGGDIEKVRELLDKAEANCLVSRSLTATVHLEPEVSAA